MGNPKGQPLLVLINLILTVMALNSTAEPCLFLKLFELKMLPYSPAYDHQAHFLDVEGYPRRNPPHCEISLQSLQSLVDKLGRYPCLIFSKIVGKCVLCAQVEQGPG